MAEDKKYYLTWEMTPHPEGITKEEVPEGHGASDALLIASMIYPEDGGLSVQTLGIDGRNESPLTNDEVFKVWTLMADALSEEESLGPGKRAVASSVVEIVRMALGIVPHPDEESP